MKELIGKRVRVIIAMGDTTIPLEGNVKEVDDKWIILESKGKIKVINKDAVVYAEES
jgi:RNase P/RNase MRP subunit p29